MFYYGIVEDIKDPKELGRARVRVFGLHNIDKNAIPTSALPWASVVQPTTSAANSGIGQTPKLLHGTLVMLTFADPEDMQFPVVVGTLPSELQEHLATINGVVVERGDPQFGFQDSDNVYPKQEYIGENDLPKLARTVTHEFPRTQHNSTNDLFSITEPEDIRGNHVYPHNQVRQSASGHFEEWDDTTTNERIAVQHKSGTFKEVRPDGTQVEKIVGSNYRIVAQGENVYIEGVCNLHINSTCNTFINGNWNVKVTGDMDLDVAGHIYQDAQTIHLNRDMGGEMGAARIDDTADTGDAGTGSHFDTNSAGTDKIETGSGTVFIGD